MKEITPERFIRLIRESDRYIESIYTEGSCYRFHLILKELFPSAEVLINAEKNHVVTRINGRLYDITGVVKSEYYPLSKEDEKKVRKWSFHEQMLISIKECPFCEEPICV